MISHNTIQNNFFVVSKKELDSSIALVNKALSEGVEVLHFNQSALTSLEAECKNAGKSFPFLIPKSVIHSVIIGTILSLP